MLRRRVLALGVCGLLGLTACQPASTPALNSMDVSGARFGGDFHLTDATGRTRSLADFRGKLVMLFFGFSQCPDVCPTTLSRAAQVRKQLGKEGEGLQVLFVTVDPERDDPELLREYTAAFDASFIGLYTDVAGTQKLAKDFRLYYRKVPSEGGYTIDHTALTYVYDRQGKLRLAIEHGQSVEQVVADLRLLLDER